MLAVTHPKPNITEIIARDDPVPSGTQLLVRVHAAGLNRADLLQRAGKYPAPPGWPADIPGLEYAGEVERIGSEVTRWRTGDRVMGLVGGGAHAELLLVDEREAMAIPAAMTFDDAAAIPEAFLTAWDALVVRGRARAGERVLVHAIGSGVGTAAAQLGRWLGLMVIGTSRTPEKLARGAALGMNQGVLTTDARWPEHVGAPVDVIIDTLGAKYFHDNLGLLADCGRHVVLSTLTGGTVTEFDLGKVLRHRLEIIGTMMRVRSHAERATLVERFSSEVLPAFTSGALVPVIDRVMPMRDVVAAHDALASDTTFGKIVLSWDA